MTEPKSESKSDSKAAKAAAAAEAAAEKPALARASEATDPAVHQLMAELQTAQMNGDADKVSALTTQLADLGYE